MRHFLARYRKLTLMLVAGILALYSALHFRDGLSETAPIEAAAPARARVAAAGLEEDPALAIALPKRDDLDKARKNDLFAPTSWASPPPPPPPAVAPPPPPPPQAPPMPYSFVGLFEDRAKPTAFLSNGQALLIVVAGDTLDGAYRVDAVGPKEITMTYLPLKQKQVIKIQGG